MQKGDVYKTHGDSKKLSKAIKFTPKVMIEDGIVKFIEWYKNIIKLMNKNSKILITGGTGLVGSSIVRSLSKKKYKNIFSFKKEMNLLDKKKVFLI